MKLLGRLCAGLGLASIACAAALHPSTASAGSTLYGFTASAVGQPMRFVSIDPTTGSVTQVGNESLPFGSYAPVFDPAQNAFYVVPSPILGPSSGVFSIGLDKIDPTGGAVTSLLLSGTPVVGGIGVNTTTWHLYGFTASAVGQPMRFVSIDPTTGSVTQVGNESLPFGSYAPVFDPAQNAFVMRFAHFGTIQRSVQHWP